jgi:hypothetical protein
MRRKQTAARDLVPVELIERRIYLIRGQKVMIDSDLAKLYQVPTKSVNLAVRRNVMRFPGDFMFQLSQGEADSLRLQIETSKTGRGGRRYLPYAFTEQGIAMLSSVLNGDRAVLVLDNLRTWVFKSLVLHGGLSRMGPRPVKWAAYSIGIPTSV